MKTFLAVYLGTEESTHQKWKSLNEKERHDREKQGVEAWMNWGKKHQLAIKDNGTPLGKTKRVDANGISDTRNNLTGYVIVEAPNAEEAAKMFLNHPHFTIFPGDSVEIVECLNLEEVMKKKT
ncbi:hypothetical protein AZI87_16620 [Bdellovibrio bacteriovorus]|uniref:YCII-related domain-containing protein n=1 Tax=Bdellovibrio bacteriovorus TaxID=959 RepID=A0A162FZS6_BDEBC|nr:hypothetical protein [Bdellovibrio bacteriovorus]KYG62890.1 hypothetical protein AZI87_16620 [Bdellovibrio bacteriovorus]